MRASDYRVETIPLAQAQELVKAYHYSGGGSNTATFRHGLVRNSDGKVLGCAWWIPPTKSAAMANHDGDWRKVLALSRLVVAPEVPRNGASFLMARSIRLIKQDGRWEKLLTYADSWQGHSGNVYRSAGWEFLGETKPERVYVRDGRMMGRKRGGKTLRHGEMLEQGFECLGSFSKARFGIELT